MSVLRASVNAARRHRYALAAALMVLLVTAAAAMRVPQSLATDWVYPAELLMAQDAGEWRVYDRADGAPLALQVEHAVPGGIVYCMAEPWRLRVARSVAHFAGAQASWNHEEYFDHGDATVINGRTFRILVNGDELTRRLEAKIGYGERRIEDARNRAALRPSR